MRTAVRVLAVVAALAATAAGCSLVEDSGDRRAQPVAAAGTTNSAGSTPSRSSAAPESATALDPDLAFRPDRRLVWREHPGPGPAPYENRDPALAPGDYRLQIRCLGGSVGIDVNGTRVADVECAGSAPSFPVCLTRPGLTVSAEWIRGPFTDLVWQLVRRPHAPCPG